MNKQTEVNTEAVSTANALKMAIEMPFVTIEQKSRFRDEVQRISKEALEQPAQEPVAWWHDKGDYVDLNVSGHGIPLYTHPAPSWQGLNDDEIKSLCNVVTEIESLDVIEYEWNEIEKIVRSIESKLKEKNEK